MAHVSEEHKLAQAVMKHLSLEEDRSEYMWVLSPSQGEEEEDGSH